MTQMHLRTIYENIGSGIATLPNGCRVEAKDMIKDNCSCAYEQDCDGEWIKSLTVEEAIWQLTHDTEDEMQGITILYKRGLTYHAYWFTKRPVDLVVS